MGSWRKMQQPRQHRPDIATVHNMQVSARRFQLPCTRVRNLSNRGPADHPKRIAQHHGLCCILISTGASESVVHCCPFELKRNGPCQADFRPRLHPTVLLEALRRVPSWLPQPRQCPLLPPPGMSFGPRRSCWLGRSNSLLAFFPHIFVWGSYFSAWRPPAFRVLRPARACVRPARPPLKTPLKNS